MIDSKGAWIQQCIVLKSTTANEKKCWKNAIIKIRRDGKQSADEN